MKKLFIEMYKKRYLVMSCLLALLVVILAVVLFFVKSADTKKPDNTEIQSQEDSGNHYHNSYEDLFNEASDMLL